MNLAFEHVPNAYRPDETSPEGLLTALVTGLIENENDY